MKSYEHKGKTTRLLLFPSFKLGYHRCDKLHRPTSSPEIIVVGIIKARRPTFIVGDEYGDEYQKGLIFIAQVHRPTTWVSLYIGKDVKIKYTSSNFSLYLCHME